MAIFKSLENEYSGQEKIPLKQYALITLFFNAILTRVVFLSAKQEKKEGLQYAEILLLGLGAHKLSRVLSKDLVTSFIRAPFTQYQEFLGYGEVNEIARKQEGVGRALGELLSCNYCMSAWTSLAFLWGASRFPRQTLSLAKFFSIFAISDFLHVAYEARRTQANVMTLREEKLDREKKHAA